MLSPAGVCWQAEAQQAGDAPAAVVSDVKEEATKQVRRPHIERVPYVTICHALTAENILINNMLYKWIETEVKLFFN